MVNITKITEDYIEQHPSIKDCVKKGVINYSSLTRKIAAEMNLDLKQNFDAILIACRRYYSKVKKETIVENKILDVLKNTKMEIKNKIIAVVIEKNINWTHLIHLENEIKKRNEPFHIIEGTSSIIIITSEDFLVEIRKLFKNKIINEQSSLVEIILKSPKEIETTSGVVPYLYSLFGEHGINIIETMSCWTDTLFVVEEKDISKAMELLRF